MTTQQTHIYFWLNDKPLSNALVTQVASVYPSWYKMIGIENAPVPKPVGFHLIVSDCENLNNGNEKFPDWVSSSHVILLIDSSEAEEILINNTYVANNYILKDPKQLFLHILLKVIKNAWESFLLKSQLHLYESVVVNTSEGVLVTEATNEQHERPRILYINDAFTEITGYTLDELYGIPLDVLRGEKTDKTEVVKIEEAFEKGHPIKTELVNYHKDGSDFWIQLNSVPVKDSHGNILYWVSIQRDITQSKKDSEEIKRINADLQDKNKKITQSIDYAKRIQNAIVPSIQKIRDIFPESFVLYRPRDIVSGDFYWLNRKEDVILFAAADCTGHGVPGAMISMLAYNLLNQTVKEATHTNPAWMLTGLDENLINLFKNNPSENQIQDGLDIGLCCLQTQSMSLDFSGAGLSLYHFRNGTLTVFNGDPFPIGIYKGKKAKVFTSQRINLLKNDTLYLFTDGIVDQAGGIDGCKLMRHRFQEMLGEAQKLNLNDQELFLQSNLDNWMNGRRQVDDILVMGIRV